jgi:hypothetical protein
VFLLEKGHASSWACSKNFRVLRRRSVAGIRIHHELDIGQVLLQD